MEELRFVTLDEVPRYECFFLFPSSSLTVLSPCPRSIRESRRVPSRRVAWPRVAPIYEFSYEHRFRRISRESLSVGKEGMLAVGYDRLNSGVGRPLRSLLVGGAGS